MNSKANSLMPADIKTVYDAIDNQIMWLNTHIRTASELFMQGEERVALLNNIAPSFFGYLQRVLLEQLIVTASRITDPHRTGGQENLTFNTLLTRVSTEIYPALHDSIRTKISSLASEVDNIRTHRHKRIVHLDSEHSKPETVDLLPPIIFTEFRSALKIARDILNEVSVFFDKVEVSHSISPAFGDVSGLLLGLKRAAEMKAEDEFKYFMGFKRADQGKAQNNEL